uniref:NADH:quinone oxidoreductase/Mrp antiporter transmembrane domain-containing protein n=1 Tax=uncultured Bacteroidota bacterium TaxID=152509 RepID=H5SGI5_9BACT|nr:hypothetical protein HGMM_F25B04C14 [uncultured Bacteroidetes bacterium]
MGGRFVLLALAAAGASVALFWGGPLTQAAAALVAAIALYAAFYLKERHGLHAGLYLLAWVGVALFEQGTRLWVLFAGWELVSTAGWGLIAWGRGCSPRSLHAAQIALLTTRLGDVFWVAGAFSGGTFPEGLWLAAMVKAGLFPFTFWLVQAMYAPAMVSALLHSALLVALGVYLPLKEPFGGMVSQLPALWVERTGETIGTVAAIGTLLSRSDKAALAWSTGSHLAFILAGWAEPSHILGEILHHSYLKAALFLLLGLKQKGYSGLGLALLWYGSAGALVGGVQGGALRLVAEGLVAWRLGGIGRGFFRGGSLGLFPWWWGLPVAVLAGLGVRMVSFAGGGLVPLALLGLGGVWRMRLPAARIDKLPLRLMQAVEKGWLALSRQLAAFERWQVEAFAEAGRKLLAWDVSLALAETHKLTSFWRYAAQFTRKGLSQLATFAGSHSYQGALRWALLITILSGFIWKLLR